MRTILPLFILIAIAYEGWGQPLDSANRSNTIKFNLISNVLFENAAVFSYERLTKPNQSWGMMVGFVQFPTLKELGSSIQVTDDDKRGGFVIGGEYRFYLKKENKYLAPRGVFVGPYANYYGFDNNRSLTYTPTDGQPAVEALLKSHINVLNIGVELGYQFVLNDRWTFDFIFVGPSVSRYAVKMDLSGNFNQTQEAILSDELLKALTNRFPLLEDLLDDNKISMHGKTSSWSTGYRYQMNIGYRFGKKKVR